MLRASIAAEAAGIPSVSIICEGFQGQASATGRGHGFDGLPLAVTVGHVDAQPTAVMVGNFVASTVEQVIEGLCGPSAEDGGGNDEPTALDVVVSGDIDAINDHFRRDLLTNRHRIFDMADGTGHQDDIFARADDMRPQ